MYVELLNFFPRDMMIKKGDRISQGIFMPFLLADGDQGGLAQRQSGFGFNRSLADIEGIVWRKQKHQYVCQNCGYIWATS